MCVCVFPFQLDVLEYIHDNEYVHADIKAANLMLGYTDPEKVSQRLFLVKCDTKHTVVEKCFFFSPLLTSVCGRVVILLPMHC